MYRVRQQIGPSIEVCNYYFILHESLVYMNGVVHTRAQLGFTIE